MVAATRPFLKGDPLSAEAIGRICIIQRVWGDL
jgi:hypothetical protein